MRTAVFRLLVLVVTFVAGGVTALAVVPHDVFERGMDDLSVGSPVDPTDSPSDPSSPSGSATPTTTTSPQPTTSTPATPAPTPPTSATSSPAQDCTPATPLVDQDATPQARCLAARLDQWQRAGEYGAGQELNLSNQDYLGPLSQLGDQQVSVVGFDLQELSEGETYGFSPSPIDTLLKLNQAGAVLTASWHMTNPGDAPGGAFDTSWRDLKALVADKGAIARGFWRDFDDKMALLRQLQSGDNGAYPPAAVIFRPMHEANGDWFWWAQPNDATTYKQLYAMMQQRAAADDVHNVVWAWSFNVASTSNVIDPSSLVPDHLDLIGIDTYEDMQGRGTPDQDMNLTGLSGMVGKAPRIAVTEAGPQHSRDGNWDPRSVGRAAVSQGLRPVYEMMWVDDSDGKKQIGSLTDGPAWLRSCPHGVCSLSRSD